MKHGLAPLQVDKDLMKVAHEKSRDIRINGYIDHISPTYGSPPQMLEKFGGEQYFTVRENIAIGYQTPESVVARWTGSPLHRDNILSKDYTHIGIGYEKKVLGRKFS